jgi:hypothetical protein
MPEIIACPTCDKKLNLPDQLLGKKVKCPGCKEMFVANAPKPAKSKVAAPPPAPAARKEKPRPPDNGDEAPRKNRSLMDELDESIRPPSKAPASNASRSKAKVEDDYEEMDDYEEVDDRPRSRRRSTRDDDYDDYDDDYDDYDDRPRRRSAPPADPKPRWRGVALGLTLWLYGVWGIIISIGVLIVLGTLIGAILFASREPLVALGLFVVVGLFYLAVFICAITMLVGLGMCMQAPSAPDHPTRQLAIGSFCCLLAPTVLGVIFGGLSVVARELGFILFIGNALLNPILSLAALVLFCLFLRSVAYQDRNRNLAERCMRWLVMYFITMGVTFVLYIVFLVFFLGIGATAAQGGPRDGLFVAAGVVSILFGVVLLGLAIWSLVLSFMLIGLVGETRDSAHRLGNKKRKR